MELVEHLSQGTKKKRNNTFYTMDDIMSTTKDGIEVAKFWLRRIRQFDTQLAISTILVRYQTRPISS